MEISKQQFKAAKILFAANILSDLSVNFEPLSPARIRIENKIKELDLHFKQLKKEHEQQTNSN
jgi:hypothetical protein